jgi:hypothetical protein
MRPSGIGTSLAAPVGRYAALVLSSVMTSTMIGAVILPPMRFWTAKGQL